MIAPFGGGNFRMDRQELSRSYTAVFWIAVVIFLYSLASFAGFALVNPQRLARYTLLVSLHGALILGWMALLAIQARLAATGPLVRHRLFGKLSVFLVAAMVIVSFAVLVSLHLQFGRPALLVGNSLVLSNFIVLYLMALSEARKRRIDWHLRYMLVATLAMLGPAHGRFMGVIGFPDQAAALMIPLTLLGPLLAIDLYSRRKIHKASVIAIGITLLFFAASVTSFTLLGGFG